MTTTIKNVRPIINRQEHRELLWVISPNFRMELNFNFKNVIMIY